MQRYLGFALATILLLCSAGYGCVGGPPSKGGGAGGSGTPGAGSCPDDLTFFQDQIWSPILTVQCLGCHNASGPARGTRMVFTPASEPNVLALNLAVAKTMAGATAVGASGTLGSILLQKPSGQAQGGHVGGTLFSPDSPSYAAFSLFVDRANGVSGACARSLDCSTQTLVPGLRALRRLSRAEYDNTITDLFMLATPSTFGAGFPADNVINNFDNNGASLTVSPLLADNIRTAAETLGASFAKAPGALLPCDPTKVGADACAVTFIQTFGARAFRRPLTNTEVVNYKTLYNLAANNATCDAPFTGGIQLVVTGMLQSPNFLYRTELGAAGSGGMFTLTPYEVASELSYLIWGSMPDATLFAAAQAGQLATPAQLGAQANRLLQSPKSRASLDHFVAQWLDIVSIGQVPKDSTVYPNITAAIRADMLTETTQSVEHAVFDTGATFTDLFTSRTSYMSSELATFYGLTPSGQPDPVTGLYQVTRPAAYGGLASQYAGVLTQGSVTAVHAKANTSSPILRGKMIREQILCQNLPPPPAGVNASPPTPTPGLSTRELYAQHATNQPCQSCHTLIDPIGFGFENFDGEGAYRTAENADAGAGDGGAAPPDGGQPVDSSATIVSTVSLDGNYAGSAAMGAAFAASSETQQCFALQWFRYAYGIDETAVLQCTVQKLAKDFASSNLALGQLIVDLTQQPHFTSRLTDGVTGNGNPPPDGTATPPVSTPPAANPLQITLSSSEGQQGVWYVTVTVTNVSTAPVTWQFDLTLNGTVSQLINAISTVNGTQVQFSGVSFNAQLQPQAQAMFNFVLTGSQPLPPTQCGP